MFRKEFIEIVTSTGMVTLKGLRPLIQNKSPSVVSELDLLKYKSFDDIKFAKILAKKFPLAFIDLSGAKIMPNVLNLMKKVDVVRFRVIPVQHTTKGITLATYDPSILSELDVIRGILKRPVEVILVAISVWRNFFNEIQESVEELLDSIKEIHPDTALDKEELKEEDIGADTVYFVNRVLAESFVKNSRDIHIDPY